MFTDVTSSRLFPDVTRRFSRQSDRPPLVMNGLRAAGYMLRHQLASGQAAGSPLAAPLVRTINNNSNEVSRDARATGCPAGRLTRLRPAEPSCRGGDLFPNPLCCGDSLT